jgi:hypothetical protein
MNRHFFTGAFLLGTIAVIWVATGFWGSHGLALTMTAIIAAVYGFGALELHRFRQATNTLVTGLEAIPPQLETLDGWLQSLHASLRNAVRLRIEGERNGLPGPALTPYLVGLLVMLGMLGTFLGMVVTLNGAVFALEGTTDLATMRSVFAAPIKGLGLAFGTSVAGVATSAMLGLMSALSRRDRMLAAQVLDTKIATVLRAFSLTHQRQETYKALQMQAQALPDVADKLQLMMMQMERMSLQLNERLLSNQESFHSNVKGVYTDLATAVDQSLRSSLSQSAHTAAQSIKPVMEAAMNGMASNMDHSLTKLGDTFGQRSTSMLTEIKDAYTRLQAEQTTSDSARARDTLSEISRLMATSEDLIHARMAAEAGWTQQQDERMDQLVSLLRTELGALREAEALRGNAAVERLGDLQTALTSHLTTLGTALESPITRLIETASEAPRAAAEVIAKLRQETSGSLARDNELLEERSRIMATLNTLLSGINHASQEQRSVIDALVANSSVALEQAGSQFSDKVDMETAKLSEIAAQVTGSSVEVSSLSETFTFAVRTFSDANDKLIANLQRIEGAMDKSMVRSDEQLAYYVAQAREVIDLSVMSQREIFEELRRLPGRGFSVSKVVGEEAVHG